MGQSRPDLLLALADRDVLAAAAPDTQLLQPIQPVDLTSPHFSICLGEENLDSAYALRRKYKPQTPLSAVARKTRGSAMRTSTCARTISNTHRAQEHAKKETDQRL